MRLACATLLLMAACDASTFGPQPTLADAGVGPEQSARPSPLDDPALARNDAGVGAGRFDGGAAVRDAAPAAPIALDAYDPLPPDEMGRDTTAIVLNARWRWRDVPAPAGTPSIDRDAIAAAEKEASGRWNIQLSADGRMRIEIAALGQPLSAGSALIGRMDRYGHVLVWPDGSRYRVIAPGALRATLGEQRVDMSPLAQGKVIDVGRGERLGLSTRKIELRSDVGSVVLELADVAEAAPAAALTCRLMAELAGVEPSSAACSATDVVLAATFQWEGGDGPGVAFEVDAIQPLPDFRAALALLPPARARRIASGLPRTPIVFDADRLAAFRTEAASTPKPADPKAPAQGLAASNRSDMQMWLLLDGVPIASVDAWQQVIVPGARAGRYSVQWRSFFGELVAPAAEVDLPARVLYGQQTEEPDAGAP
jgi:hypothetical protein